MWAQKREWNIFDNLQNSVFLLFLCCCLAQNTLPFAKKKKVNIHRAQNNLCDDDEFIQDGLIKLRTEFL